MIEYNLCRTDNIPQPLSDVESDTKIMGSDFRNHVSELEIDNGKVKYGGEQPWVHVWETYVHESNIPYHIDQQFDNTEKQFEELVDNIMTFVDKTCTPHNTTTDDFVWNIYLHESDNPMIRSGSWNINLIFKPK